MEMEMSMEEDEYSSDSNTDAIIFGVSDPSGSDECMISGPNISSSSSDDDISHQEQEQQQQILAAAPDDLIVSSSSSNDEISHQEQLQQIPAVAGTDDLTVSSPSWITNNNNNSNKQIEEEAAIMIFNVDFEPPPVYDKHEEDLGIGSSEVTSNSQSSELVWGDMAEAWFNAIPAGWRPGSPIWDDLDTNNNLMFSPNLHFGNFCQQEPHNSDPHQQSIGFDLF